MDEARAAHASGWGLRCRDKTRRGDRVAVPKAPSETAPGRCRAERLERSRVERRGADVGDREPPARLEHAPRFRDRPGAVGVPTNVVDGETRDDEIEGAIGKGQRAHVAGLDIDAIEDPLQRGIASRDVAGIAGLIARAPEIDADDAPRRQPLCDGDEYRAAATAH